MLFGLLGLMAALMPLLLSALFDADGGARLGGLITLHIVVSVAYLAILALVAVNRLFTFGVDAEGVWKNVLPTQGQVRDVQPAPPASQSS